MDERNTPHIKSSRSRLILVCLLAVGVGLLFYGLNSQSTSVSATERERSGETKSEDAPASLAKARSASSFSGQAVLSQIVGAEGPAIKDPLARFSYLKDCAKFRHFDAFYRRKTSDPSWPFPDDTLSPEEQAKTLETMKFLESHRGACTAWVSETSQDLASAQVQFAALEAARAGSEIAGACFIMSPWGEPSNGSPYMDSFRKAYAENARLLVSQGIEKGSWPILHAANMAAKDEHGFRTVAAFTAKDKYLFARLAQLGAPDGNSESNYGYDAAYQAKFMSAAEMIALDKRASELYVSKFNRQRFTGQQLVDACAN